MDFSHVAFRRLAPSSASGARRGAAGADLACRTFSVGATADGVKRRVRYKLKNVQLKAAITKQCSNLDLRYKWEEGGTVLSTEQRPLQAFDRGEHTVNLTVSCSNCSTPSATDTVEVVAYEVAFAKPQGDPGRSPGDDNEYVYRDPGRAEIPVQVGVLPLAAISDLGIGFGGPWSGFQPVRR